MSLLKFDFLFLFTQLKWRVSFRSVWPTSKIHLLWPSFGHWRRRSSITSSSKISVSYSKEPFWISLSKTKRCVLPVLHSYSLGIRIHSICLLKLSFFFQVLQETAGGVLSIDNQDPGTYGFRPSRQDVFEFIKQCGEGDVSFQCVLCVERHPAYRDIMHAKNNKQVCLSLSRICNKCSLGMDVGIDIFYSFLFGISWHLWRLLWGTIIW